MMSPDAYSQESLAAAGLHIELVLAVAFIDDGKGNIRRAFLTEGDDAMPTGGERIVGIVPPPPNLCVVFEDAQAGPDPSASAPPKTLGAGRIDAEGNFYVGEPWAIKTREAIAYRAELARLR